MSGNINDTNVSLLRKQVYDLIGELNENTNNYKFMSIESLETKYDHLVKSSKTLFKFIVSNTIDTKFYANLEMMLNKIEEIQQNKISQFNASGVIGTHLTKTYVPKLD